jgi:hypothetical protein
LDDEPDSGNLEGKDRESMDKKERDPESLLIKDSLQDPVQDGSVTTSPQSTTVETTSVAWNSQAAKSKDMNNVKGKDFFSTFKYDLQSKGPFGDVVLDSQTEETVNLNLDPGHPSWENDGVSLESSSVSPILETPAENDAKVMKYQYSDKAKKGVQKGRQQAERLGNKRQLSHLERTETEKERKSQYSESRGKKVNFQKAAADIENNYVANPTSKNKSRSVPDLSHKQRPVFQVSKGQRSKITLASNTRFQKMIEEMERRAENQTGAQPIIVKESGNGYSQSRLKFLENGHVNTKHVLKTGDADAANTKSKSEDRKLGSSSQVSVDPSSGRNDVVALNGEWEHGKLQNEERDVTPVVGKLKTFNAKHETERVVDGVNVEIRQADKSDKNGSDRRTVDNGSGASPDSKGQTNVVVVSEAENSDGKTANTTFRPESCRGCFAIHFPTVINHKDYCTNFFPRTVILLLISSSPHNTQQRLAIRDSWGKQCQDSSSPYRCLFVLGQTDSLEHNVMIQQENYKFQDILQFAFLDSYSNLTLKTLTAFQWVEQHCGSAHFVMKTDDDMYVNTNLLPILLTAVPREDFVGGFCWGTSPPHRDVHSKWYVSRASYPQSHFPPMCSGTGYIMSRDVVAKVLEASRNIPFFYLEDVYVALCLQKQGISPVRIAGFSNVYTTFIPCQYRNHVITSHEVPYSVLPYYWAEAQACPAELKTGTDLFVRVPLPIIS